MKNIKRIIAILLTASILFGTGIIASAADEGTATNTGVVARMYLCHKASTDHTWIYIENISDKSIQVGAYPYMIPKGSGVSVGTYGTTVEDGPGLYYNVEAWRYQNKDIYGPITYSIHKDLTEKQLEKVNKTIRSINHWSKLRNCAHAAMKIWNSVPGTHMVYIFLPLFHLMQIRSKKDCVNGYLKMKATNLKNNTWKQVGRGDNATIEYTDPKPVEYQD